MAILFNILEDGNIPTEVKNIGIVAVGDICLSSERRFVPYFERSMNTLISAGQMCLQLISD